MATFFLGPIYIPPSLPSFPPLSLFLSLSLPYNLNANNNMPNSGKHRGLAVFALAAAGLAAVGVQYKRTALRRNEQAQRDYAENRYVSVDRSGGGI